MWEIEKDFEQAGAVPADMRQLFAFMLQHGKKLVTEKNPKPIIAAAPESRWLCSHECLHEAAAFYWSSWYHNPGISLHTESAEFEKGTRFLIIK